MRKITSLLMLFCMCVATAWAGPTDLPEITTDLNNPIYYTIYNTRSSQPGGLMYYAGDNVGLKDGLTSRTLTNEYKFYFTGSHDALYVHNAATDKKLASVDSWTDAGIAWTVSAPTGNGLAFGPKGESGNVFWNDKNYATNSTTSDFTVWGATDAGSIFVCEKAENYTYPETGKLYVIECPLFEGKQGVKKALYVNSEGVLSWGTLDLTDKAFYWTPVNDEGRFILKNAKVTAEAGWESPRYLNGVELTNSIGSATEYTLRPLGANQFNIISGEETIHANGHGGGVNNEGNIVSWNGILNSASAWTFVEKQDPDAVQSVTVKYTFTYGGAKKYEQSTTTLVGEEYPAITVELPYGVSATKPEGKIAAGDVVEGVVTKEIKLSVNLPFVPAADYASINKWYYIQMHSNPTYSKYLQSADNYIEWADATVDVVERNSYVWGFIGNPFDGFKLVNYGAGAEKGVNSNGSGNPALGDIATATQWQIKASATNPDNEHFCFQYPGSNQYMNAQSGKVAFWGSADNGSTMWVTEVDLTGSADLQALIDRVDALVEAGVASGTTVGYITQESAAAVAEKLTAAKAEIAKDDKTLETVTAAQTALQTAVDNAQTIQPEEGKFYIVKSAMPNTDSRSNQKMYVNNDGGMQFNNQNAALENVFQFVSAGEGKFYLKSVERGTFMNTNKGHNGGQETAVGKQADAKAIAIANMGRANVVSLIPTGGAMMHAQAAGSQVVAWNNTDNAGASAWIIEEVNIEDFTHQVTVGAAGYSTLVLGYNAEIPEGVEAYVVSTTDNGWATLTPVTGVLPAGEAVVLKNEGTYNFNYSTATPATVENNLLEGTVFNTYIEGATNTDYYVLSVQEGEVGLYKAALNKTATGSDPEEGQQGTHFKNNAFKAYLPLTTTQGVQALRFNFDGETTVIETVETENANAPIYDLSGRRVLSTVKGGIYIQNGKKFIVK